MVDVVAYKEAAEAELAKIQQLMLDTWGYAPDIELVVETQVRVKANFNLQGFAHDGVGVIIRDSNAGRRTPEKVARQLSSEITNHRNTCDRCGEGDVPPLRQRMERMESLQFGLNYERAYGRPQMVNDKPLALTEAAFHRLVLDEAGQPVMVQSEWDRKPRPKWEIAVGAADTPADAVELYLNPRRARRLNKAIARYRAAEEAKRKAAMPDAAVLFTHVAEGV